MATEIDIAVTTTTYDVTITATPNEYVVNITTNAGGGGVQTVTGPTVDNTDPLNPVVGVPNLTQVLTVGDLLIGNSGIGSDTFLTLQLGDELTENYFNTSGVGTGGIFLDKDVIFPNNSTIRFQAGFAEDGGGSVTLDSYKFTTDAHVYYQGAEVTDITIQPSDVCMLKWAGLGGDGVQIWILTVVNKSTSSGGGTPYTPPYVEFIFTAVQTAPQTGITSGALINGGRYTIFDNGTADFTISGAPNNDTGTVFIANSTPPDWGDFGTLDFEGNPVVTILNNPLSDTYTSHYTAIGSYYLEGILDFPANTFPKLGTFETVDLNLRCLFDFSGISNGSYLWYLNPLNPKQIIFKTANGDVQVDDVLDGSQLFIVKIFNS